MNKSVKDLVLCGILSGMLVISKEILAFLPNIELVSFFLILFTLYLGLYRSLLITIVFVFIEWLLYGFGLWTISYFYTWPLLCLLTHFFKNKLKTYQGFGLLSGFFGLSFGFWMAIPNFILSLKFGWIYFLKGLPYDVIHCIGNYLIMIILYDPISKAFEKLQNKI